jgi:hypothetical protein
MRAPAFALTPRSVNRVRLAAILGVLGPGLVSGFADNDAGGITTYSVAGAKFGYDLLWVLLISQIVLFFTQEVGARLGLATGQGLAGLVRERYGVRWASFMITSMLIANLGSIVAEFAGCGAAVTCSGCRAGSGHLSQQRRRRGAADARQLQVGPVHLRGRGHRRFHRVFRVGPSGSSDWGRAASSLVIPRSRDLARLLGRGRGHGRNHDHAVGPGLHPVLRRGQAAGTRGPGRRADRRGFRCAAHQPDRPVHRRGMRRGRLFGRQADRHQLARRGSVDRRRAHAAGRVGAQPSCSR